MSSPEVWASDLRLDEDYVFYYNNLAKLIVTGLLPFLSLSFFNFKIYAKIRSRRSSTGPVVVSAEHQQQINEENRQVHSQDASDWPNEKRLAFVDSKLQI